MLEFPEAVSKDKNFDILQFLRELRSWLRNKAAFWFLRRRTRRTIPSSRDEQRVRTAPARMFRTFNPCGFPTQLEISAHPSLATIRKRLVLALFERVGLEWVPGEYWAKLRSVGEPIAAFKEFCADIGIDATDISAGRPQELNMLQRGVGLLLDLVQIPEPQRLAIYHQLRFRQYDVANGLVDRALSVLHVLSEIEKHAPSMPFASYTAFVAEVGKYRDDLFGLSVEAAIQARSVHRTFVELRDVYQALIGAFDEAEEWILSVWPDDDWGADNLTLRDGILFTSHTIRSELADLPDIDIADRLSVLKDAHEHLLGLIEELKCRADATGWERKAGGPMPEGEALHEKLARSRFLLGLPPEGPLKLSDINRMYRKLAMSCHPDRNPLDPEATTRFLQIKAARDFLIDNLSI